MSATPLTVHAETGAVIIAADTSLQVGDTLQVTVKYSAAGLGLIDGELRYDPDMLKYVSGGTSADPNGGSIKLYKKMAGETSQLFTIRFVAVGSGSDFFLVNTFQLKDNVGNDLGKPGASVKLIVSDESPQPDPEQPIVAPDEPIEDPVVDVPDTTENPNTEKAGADSDVTDSDSEENTPETMWVFIGAIGVTIVLLVFSLILVNRRRK